MRIEGEEAKLYRAVRLDSFADVNSKGELVSADDQTGEVVWRYKIDGDTKEEKVTLGAHAIRIVRAGR